MCSRYMVSVYCRCISVLQVHGVSVLQVHCVSVLQVHQCAPGTWCLYCRYMVSVYCRYIVVHSVSVLQVHCVSVPLFSEIHQVWLSLSLFLLKLQGLSVYVYWYQNVYPLKHPNLHAHSQTSKQSKSKHLSVWMPLFGSPPGDQAFDGSCQHVTKHEAGQWQREACEAVVECWRTVWFLQVMPFSTACNTPLSNFESGQNYKDVVDPAGMLVLLCVSVCVCEETV